MPTVLITGTSTGFGQLTTELLAARGWRVFATMRELAKKDSLEQALKQVGLSDRVTFERLDVTDPASIEAAVKSILAQTGNTLDAVVHNAGAAIVGALEDMPENQIRRVMEPAKARPHRCGLEPGGARRPAGKLNLQRFEMGSRRMGLNPWPTSSTTSAFRSSSSNLAPIGPRSGIIRGGSCRRLRGCGSFTEGSTGIRQGPPAIQERWRSSSPMRCKRRDPASATRSASWPISTIFYAARCRRGSSAEVRRDILACPACARFAEQTPGAFRVAAAIGACLAEAAH
jgi:hypothetical protein